MVTFNEVPTYADLSDDAVEAIARHEHLPVFEAMRVGEVLLKTPQGQHVIRLFMEENLLQARSTHLAAALEVSLNRFRAAHPESG